MKILRALLTSALLASLAVMQLPGPASCQMGYSVAFSRVCQMPCCKKMPMPKCPHYRAQAPRDVIAVSPASMIPQFHVIAAFHSAAVWQPIVRSFLLMPVIQILAPPLLLRSFLSRAPPADSPLLSA